MELWRGKRSLCEFHARSAAPIPAAIRCFQLGWSRSGVTPINKQGCALFPDAANIQISGAIVNILIFQWLGMLFSPVPLSAAEVFVGFIPAFPAPGLLRSLPLAMASHLRRKCHHLGNRDEQKPAVNRDWDQPVDWILTLRRRNHNYT